MTAYGRQGAWEAAAAAGCLAESLYRRLPAPAHVQHYGDFRVELGDVMVQLGRPDEAARLWAEVLREREQLPYGAIHHEAQARLEGLTRG